MLVSEYFQSHRAPASFALVQLADDGLR
jgi:hypothetical protein